MRFAALLCAALPLCGAGLRVGTFRADATPAMGEPLIWVAPVKQVLDPLWAKGVILDDGRTRYVLTTLDWCGIGGSTHRLFRTKIAKAAGTDVEHVVVQTLHQHTAPYIIGDAYEITDKLPAPPLRMSQAYLEKVTDAIAAAVKEAAGKLEPFDSVGTGTARVEQVASQRRIFLKGKLVSRVSTAGKDPAMAAAEEGFIDPDIRTVTLARGKTPLARLHFYATHPQTFCCDGRVTADFVGAAREAREAAGKVFELYFTGCAGNVTVGKYNDTSDGARAVLAKHLEAAMAASEDATRYAPAGKAVWRTAPLTLPKKTVLKPEGKTPDSIYRAATSRVFAERKEPVQTASLQIGGANLVFLPGEPMLEFQKYAQGLGRFVAVAGYGDISPEYICTDRAFEEGGYEPTAANGGPGSEKALKEAIRKLLGR